MSQNKSFLAAQSSSIPLVVRLSVCVSVLGRGSIKKTRLFIHILWISVLPPPPLIHVGGFYNNIIKFKYYPHRLTPPPLALIHISNFYNIF